MGYKLPWVLLYLEQWRKNGYWLSLYASSHAKLLWQAFGLWSSTVLSIVGWVDACNCKCIPCITWENCCSVGVQSQRFRLGFDFTRKTLKEWKWFQILWIFGVFPWLVIEYAVFVVDCPDYLGYFSVRIEKTWVLDLATVTMRLTMPKFVVCIHAWVV